MTNNRVRSTSFRMRVIVGCEFSQVVTKAFRDRGHEAFSCDLIGTEGNPDWHIQADLFTLDYSKYDLGIFHPDCTRLTVSGNRTYAGTPGRRDAVEFVKRIWSLPLSRMVIENPTGVLSTQWRKPTQYINPWEYGHGETKRTCLWIRGLSLLKPTNIVDGREQRIWKMGPSKKYDRKKERSRTYQGWADAMAHQWG